MNPRNIARQKKYWIVLLGIILIGGAVTFAFYSNDHILGETHIHADFKVYLEGKAYNFSQLKYMSNDTFSTNRFIHMHDGKGNIIHQHINGVTLGNFFKGLNMTFNSTCFVTDTSFCNSKTKTLKFYVNGNRNMEFNLYELKDDDRILITYGNESSEEIDLQLASITADACIQSGTCPERGTPSNESSCTTSGGCVI